MRRVVALVVALATVLCSPLLAAQGDAAAGESRPSLVVYVDAGSSGLSPEEIRLAIGQELGVETVAGGEAAGTLSVRVVAGRAGVSFIRANGEKLVRWIDLPREKSSRVEVIALLAGNLARDEAASLLEGLKKPAAEPAPEPPPAAEPALPSSVPPAPVKTPPTVAAKPSTASKPEASPEQAPEEPRFANLSLFHPLSLVEHSERHTFNLELGLAYGRIGGLEGLGLDIGHLRVDGRARGVAVSALWTRIDGDAHGAIASGILSQGGGALHGVELAGLAALRQGKVEGVQGSGGFNYSGDLDGVQLSVVNIAGNVRGAQLGIVNIGGEVRGTQIGLVNVADRVGGVPLGLVNVVKNGRTQAVAWADTQIVANAAVKYLNGPIYTLVGAGYDGGDGAAAAFAIGGHLGLGSAAYLELDALYRYVSDFDDTDSDPDQHLSALRLLVGLEGLGPVGAFAGGGVAQEVDAHGERSDAKLYGVAGLTLF